MVNMNLFKGSYLSIRYPFLTLFYVYPGKKIKPSMVKPVFKDKLIKDYKAVHLKNFFNIDGRECWTEWNFNSIKKIWWTPSPVNLDSEKWELRKGLDVYKGKTARFLMGLNLRPMILKSKDKKQYLIAKI